MPGMPFRTLCIAWLACAASVHAAPYSAVPLPPFSDKILELQTIDCSLRTPLSNAQLTGPATPSVQAMDEVLAQSKLASAIHLNRLAPAELQWWLSVHTLPDMPPFGLQAVTLAVHETIHRVSAAATACNGGLASYYFDGQAWPTELRQGELPRNGIAARHIPPELQALRKDRYQLYIARIGQQEGNDLALLLSEFNAYTATAELELALAGSAIQQEAAAQQASVDDDVAGSADFMLFTLAYLRALREDYPADWQRIKSSPLLVAHIQRIWSSAERVQAARQQLGLAYFQVSPAVLALVYQPAFIGELDRLGIRHLPKSPYAS